MRPGGKVSAVLLVIMINPFEHHPDNKNILKNNKKSTIISIKKIEEIFNKKVNELDEKAPPTWGYSQKNLMNVLDELLQSIKTN